MTSVTRPETGAKTSDTAFTDSTVPSWSPFFTTFPTSGRSRKTMSPSCFWAKSVMPMRPDDWSSHSWSFVYL